jgi:hypothetical protein
MKKWIHIILSVWLINAVTYFHSSSPADLFSIIHTDSTTDDESCFHANTWVDYITAAITDADDAAPSKAHSIKYQRRYVRRSCSNDTVFVPAPDLLLYFQHIKYAVVNTVSNYTIGVALRPAYYNFLFRLSPF